MRIFTSFHTIDQTLLVEKTDHDLKLALKKACEVLEISIETDKELLAPSDERAIDAILEFFENQPLGNLDRGNALTISNLNTGRSLLLLSRFCYYG